MEFYIIKQAFYEKNKPIVKQELKWEILYGEKTELKAIEEVNRLEIESIKEYKDKSFRFTYDYEKTIIY